MNEIQKSLIYLLACAVNGMTPEQERIQAIDMEKLYRLAKFHTVRAAVCIALERAGVQEPHFHQAYKKALRKNIYLDMERAAIIAKLEEHGIWYMPLKGSLLKDIYPESGMREMADNDMLYDASRQEEVRQIMTGMGYTAESVGISHHDVYQKPPVLNFELHTALFCELHAEPLYRYYMDIKRLLHKDGDNAFGYHFSDEDFYVFMTAHEWKHYSNSGTGIRSLLDCYVWCRAKGDSLDWVYITEQCRQLEINDFEQARRELAERVFSTGAFPALNDAETEMLLCYLTAGTYGTLERAIHKQLRGKSIPAFWFGKIFPTRKALEESVPFTQKSPLLYPLGVIWRGGRAVLFRRARIKQTRAAVRNFRRKK